MDEYFLCRECGAYVGVDTWETTGGHCARCAIGIRPAAPVKVGAAELADNDTHDPIRDAVDRAARDWADDNQQTAETKQ